MLVGRGEISQVGISISCSDHEEMLSRLCWPCEMCHITLPHLQTSYKIVCSDFARQNFHSDAVAIYTHASLPSSEGGHGRAPLFLRHLPRGETPASLLSTARLLARSWSGGKGGRFERAAHPPSSSFPSLLPLPGHASECNG